MTFFSKYPFRLYLLAMLRRAYSVSEASFILFQRFVALVLLVDLTYRFNSLEVFFTDAGVLPRQALKEILRNPYVFSPLLWNGSYSWALCFVIMGFIGALGLLFQWKPFWSLLSSLIVQITLTARNPYVVHGGDDLLRVMLIWALFLQMEKSWLVKKRNSYFGLSSVLFVAQLLIMYQFTALLKMDPAWLHEGTAVRDALELNSFVTPFGEWMRLWPQWLLKFLTQSTWAIEAGLLLCWSLIAGQRRDRDLICFLMMGFHFGLSLAFYLGSFPWICMAYWMALLSAETSEKILKFLRLPFLSKIKPKKTKAQQKNFSKYFKQGLCGLMIVFAITAMAWNIGTLKKSFYHLQSPFWELGHALRMHQQWDMFSPHPTNEDGWFVIEGVLKEGKTIDLWRNNQEVSAEAPPNIAQSYINTMWRKYLINLWIRDYKSYRPFFLNYLCQNKSLASVRLIFMFQPTKKLGDPGPRTIEKVVLADKNCD